MLCRQLTVGLIVGTIYICFFCPLLGETRTPGSIEDMNMLLSCILNFDFFLEKC